MKRSMLLVLVIASSVYANDMVINKTAGLHSYPNAKNLQITTKGIDSTIRFQTNDRLAKVFQHFNAELIAGNWQQTDIAADDDEIEADYARGWRELELDLDVDNDGYSLKVDFEDNDRPGTGNP